MPVAKLLDRPIVNRSSLKGGFSIPLRAGSFAAAGYPCQIECQHDIMCCSTDTTMVTFDNGQHVAICGWHREALGLR